MLGKSTEAGSQGHGGVAVCKLIEAVHLSPRHSVPVSHGKMHLEAMSCKPTKGYNYQKLTKKWKYHLPLGKSDDAERELIGIFPKLSENIGTFPKDKTKLHSFLGMVHFLTKFVPKLSVRTSDL